MKLYFGNLPDGIDDAKLKELVSPFGSVESADVITERDSGRSRGFGFVELASDEEGRAAIAGLDGKDVDGKAIKVNEARARKDAGHGGSRR